MGFDRGWNPTMGNFGSVVMYGEKGGGAYSFGVSIGKSWRGLVNPFSPVANTSVSLFSNEYFTNFNPFNVFRY